MPALETTPNNNDEHGPINPVVGIIYPPPEVRSILFNNATFQITVCYCNKFIFPDNFAKISSTKPLVLSPEMAPNSRRESDKTNWVTPNSISSIRATRIMPITNTKSTISATVKVRLARYKFKMASMRPF